MCFIISPMKQTSVQYTLDTLDTLAKITRCRLQRIKTMGLLFFLLCVACGNAAGETRLKLGIERLPEYREVFAGKRVGLITNQTGIDAEGTPSAVLLSRAAQLTVLFSPEHGIQGNEREGASIGHSTDPRTGLPVYSLYGNTKRPTPEMLKDIDVLCFDIQDVGARF